LLREGAAGIRAKLVTTRSSWIEFESDDALPVRLGASLRSCPAVTGRLEKLSDAVSQWRSRSVLPLRRSGFSDHLLCSEIDMRAERVASQNCPLNFPEFVAVREAIVGPKRTRPPSSFVSAFGGKADTADIGRRGS